MMKVSGFTLIRNGIIFDYPFLESIQSLLPLVDELIINVGIGEDQTWETIKQFSGLWKSNMRLQTVTTWQLLLPGIEMDRREAYKSTNLFGLIFH